MHPSVRNLPLSDKRVRHTLTEMFKNFTNSAIGRKIIKPVSLERGDKRREEKGFVRIGFNHIIDKIWFVESVFDDTYYGYEGIGSGYGRGIADSEANYIVTHILDECKERTIGFRDEIHPSDILRSLEFLEQSETEAKIILVDIKNHLQLWRYRNLMTHGQLRVPMAFSGYSHDIEIHFFRGMPKGTSIIIDPEKLGELLIKQSIEEVACISDIKNSEKEETLRDIPSMTPEMLYEKVRLLVYETVKVNIINPNAAVILQEEKSGSSEEVKII